MYPLRLSLICRISLISLVAAAGQAMGAREMNLVLNDSVMLAVRNNLSLRGSEFELKAAQSELARIRAYRNANLNVAVVGSQQTFVSENQLSAATYSSSRTEAQLKKMLFPSRELHHDIALSKKDAMVALLENENVRNSVILTAKSLHWKMITLNNLLVVQKKRLDRYRKIGDVAKTKERYGMGFRLDTRWAETQLGLAEDGLSEVGNELKLTELQLRQALGIEPDVALHFLDTLPETPESAAPLLSRVAVPKNQNDMKIGSLLVDKKIEDKHFARRRVLPNFGVTGGYNDIDGRSASAGLDDSWTASVTGSYPIEYQIPIYYQNNYFINFHVSYDIWDGLRARANSRLADEKYRAEQTKLEETQSALNERIEKDRSELRNAMNRVKTLDRISVIAEENVKLSQLRYNQGRSSLTDFLGIETDGFEAMSKLLDARYDLNMAVEAVKQDLRIGDYSHD